MLANSTASAAENRRSLLCLLPARLPLEWMENHTVATLHVPRFPAAELVDSAKWLVRALLTEHPRHASIATRVDQAWRGAVQWQPISQLASRVPRENPSGSLTGLLNIRWDRAATYTSLLSHKTELIVRGVYGAGKTHAVHCALTYLLCAARASGQVYYAVRENATIVAMATFVQQLLPRAPDNEWLDAIQPLSQLQSRTSESTPLNARDTDQNPNVWHLRPLNSTLHNFGTSTAHWPKLWIILTAGGVVG